MMKKEGEGRKKDEKDKEEKGCKERRKIFWVNRFKRKK